MIRAVAAARTLKYSGVRVVEFRRGADRLRHTEYILKDGPRSRVEFPPDSEFAGQVIVETGDQRKHYLPGPDEVQTMPARGDEALERFASLLKNGRRFQIRPEPGGMVAGVRTELAVVSDPQGNVVQRLWVDPNTGMVLKRQLFDAVGAQVGSFEFQSVNYNPRFAPGDFEISRRGAHSVALRDRVRVLSRQHGLLPYTLGAGGGFELRSVAARNPGGGEPMLVQTYQTPHGALSLFQTKGVINSDRLQKLAGERLKTFSWRQDGSSFALVGDVELTVLKRLAGSVGSR